MTGLRAGAGIGLALVAALGSAGAEPAAEVPLPPDKRALAVLEAHCARCHQEGRTEGASPDRFGMVLSLDELAEDPALVVPGRPDASRLYQRMVGGHAPLESYGRGEGDAGPSPEETEAVRDWIESLPLREDGCRDRTPVTADEIASRVRRWSEAVGEREASGTRFLSLAHLWNACVSLERLREFREATALLLGALTRRREALQLETLGEESALLVLRPGEQALLAPAWEPLTADAPLSKAGAVPADWLAARVLSGSKDEGGIRDVRFDGAAERAVAALARSWSRDVDLVRAAAERGVAPRALKATLADAEGELLVPARRLAYGALARPAWDRLSRALGGGLRERIESNAPSDQAIDIVLWPDRPFYRPRDLVTFNVRVGKACHLTLINVDRDGKAVVLFPNELEPDNLVAPGVTVRVPGHEAGYRLRFDMAGEETVVAVCQRHARRPEGIAYDYERQRFAILGDWRTFLATAPAREREIRAREAAEATRRRRRGRSPAPKAPPPVAPDGPAIEGRAAVTVTVEPGGKH